MLERFVDPNLPSETQYWVFRDPSKWLLQHNLKDRVLIGIVNKRYRPK